MRVGSTGLVINLKGQSRKVTGQPYLDVYIGRLVGPWSLVLSPGSRALCFLTGNVCSIIMWWRAKNDKETTTHAGAINHARSARPPGPLDERPDERASYLCSLWPRQAA